MGGLTIGLVVALTLVFILIIVVIVIIVKRSWKSKERLDGSAQFDNRIYNHLNNRPWTGDTNEGSNELFPRTTVTEPNPYDSLGPCSLSTFTSDYDNSPKTNHQCDGDPQDRQKCDDNPYASLRVADMLKYSNVVDLPTDKTESLGDGYMEMRGSCSSDNIGDMSKDGTYLRMEFQPEGTEEDSNQTLISSNNDVDADPVSYVNNGYATHISVSK
ncbi:uncharacterized protein LOC132551237 [Ylistrum balloti]|uniref:uncharacterized protein LOC132551237 n=1 Tax=Ylistrum balloti TaxID=509963 RepID=UPI002905ACE4|nr:uncharacterized protein LOC132551237 [Ylistrum balloti]